MKVIKEGKWNIVFSANATCTKCEAELLLEEADIKAFDYTSNYGFVCCICGHQNNMEAIKIPERIRNNVDKNRKHSSSSDWR